MNTSSPYPSGKSARLGWRHDPADPQARLPCHDRESGNFSRVSSDVTTLPAERPGLLLWRLDAFLREHRAQIVKLDVFGAIAVYGEMIARMQRLFGDLLGLSHGWKVFPARATSLRECRSSLSKAWKWRR